jgi:hypothetical protein
VGLRNQRQQIDPQLVQHNRIDVHGNLAFPAGLRLLKISLGPEEK